MTLIKPNLELQMSFRMESGPIYIYMYILYDYIYTYDSSSYYYFQYTTPATGGRSRHQANTWCIHQKRDRLIVSCLQNLIFGPFPRSKNKLQANLPEYNLMLLQ